MQDMQDLGASPEQRLTENTLSPRPPPLSNDHTGFRSILAIATSSSGSWPAVTCAATQHTAAVEWEDSRLRACKEPQSDLRHVSASRGGGMLGGGHQRRPLLCV